jgi:hypothetical protein
MKFTLGVSSQKEQYGEIIATVCDKHGNVTQKITQPIDSFNRQFWRNYWSWLINGFNNTMPADYNMTAVDGSTTTTTGSFTGRSADGAPNSYCGIIVGSGAAATTINSLTLESIIDFGTGNGQISAGEVATDWDMNNATATITRSFVNDSADLATFTINEVGIAVSVGANSATKALNFMYVRDVLNATLTVLAGSTLNVQYKVRVSGGNNNYKNIATRRQFAYLRGAANTRTDLVNTTGTARLESNTLLSGIMAPEGVLIRGIVLGTGNTAFSVTDINLGTRIDHGSNAGQLHYLDVSNTVIRETTSTNTIRYSFYRPVENRSGSNITVTEAGLFVNGSATNGSYMIDRHVLDSPLVITNGEIVNIKWDFEYVL